MQDIRQRQQSPVKREEVNIVEEELDPDTIEYILKTSPGPFHMYVMGEHQVKEVYGEDEYDRNLALERKVLYGKDVKNYI